MGSSGSPWLSSSSRLRRNAVRETCAKGRGEQGDEDLPVLRGVFDDPNPPPPNAGVLCCCCCWLFWPKPPKPPPNDIVKLY